MQQTFVNLITSKQVLRTTRSHDREVRDGDVGANIRVAADDVAADRVIRVRRGTVEVFEVDVGNGEAGRKLIAQGEVVLAVALGDLHGVVDLVDEHVFVGDVADAAGATAALEVAGECGGRAGPDFDASSVRCIVHRDVVDLS